MIKMVKAEQARDHVFLFTEENYPVLGVGDVVRWIKCIFKDCSVEDAKKDHESAEK